MFYFFKPLPPSNVELNNAKPFIQNEWFNKNFMKFVYALQLLLVVLSIVFGVWEFSNWLIKIAILIVVFLVHELLHILVVYKIGDISLTHSGIFFWLNSNAVMSKKRFWLFMALPILILTIIPICLLPLVNGFVFETLVYVAWINAIVAGADIINSVLIAIKPKHAKFCRGYYSIEKDSFQN